MEDIERLIESIVYTLASMQAKDVTYKHLSS